MQHQFALTSLHVLRLAVEDRTGALELNTRCHFRDPDIPRLRSTQTSCSNFTAIWSPLLKFFVSKVCAVLLHIFIPLFTLSTKSLQCSHCMHFSSGSLSSSDVSTLHILLLQSGILHWYAPNCKPLQNLEIRSITLLFSHAHSTPYVFISIHILLVPRIPLHTLLRTPPYIDTTPSSHLVW